MKFAKWTFALAGVYGVGVLAPMYFTETRFGLENPPPVSHPAFYYGFVGLALVFQVVFFVIARDPIRYRPLMVVALFEKLSFGIPALILNSQGRLAPPLMAGATIDLILFALFFVALLKTPRS